VVDVRPVAAHNQNQQNQDHKCPTSPAAGTIEALLQFGMKGVQTPLEIIEVIVFSCHGMFS
jgi:hypothetical protein